ncbi:hypothetical protein TELCIR_07991 [Teladorsagia circumcincta]|uniref:Uncharacterized protein n=1 Tax=Teladorsagia circumcincta TaxID=45464 RepID=A0A2G9UJ09_TELCI|nr:hypothetical protein TELCIR_07991 [Teladorsagia circumcincta]
MPSTRGRSKTPCPDEAQQPEPPSDDATAERLQGGKVRRGRAPVATAGDDVPGRDVQEDPTADRGLTARDRVVPEDVEEDRGDHTHDLEEAVADPTKGPREEADDHESMHPAAGEVADRAGRELEELLENHAVVIQREDS